jgi:predicted dehydrogenase
VLSEKPVAENVARAEQLIEFYARNAKEGATWSVAENFRFLNTFGFAKGEVGRLGRVLGFRVKVFANVKPGTKYFGRSLDFLFNCAGWRGEK